MLTTELANLLLDQNAQKVITPHALYNAAHKAAAALEVWGIPSKAYFLYTKVALNHFSVSVIIGGIVYTNTLCDMM